MGRNGNNSEKKPDTVVRLGSEGGYAEVARDLKAEIATILAQDQTLHIGEEEVEARKRLFLAADNRVAVIEAALEESIRESSTSAFKSRDKVVFYLGAAEAYEELSSEERADADKITGQSE